MTIEVERNGQWLQLNPEDLTTDELCWCLDAIQIESEEFLSQKEIDEGYAAIVEAVRRLQEGKQRQVESHGDICKPIPSGKDD